jgi:polyhydroxyalkanoate synthase
MLSFEDSVQDMLGIAEQPLDATDPSSFLRALRDAAVSAACNPVGSAIAGLGYARNGLAIGQATVARVLGTDAPAPLPAPARDGRFKDPAWSENPAYFALQQLYLLHTRLVSDLLDAAALAPAADRKARFAAAFLTDAASPTNTLPGNPAAMRRAFETGGRSVARGLRNFVHDVRHNGGWPSQVDASGFVVGENLATTPGKVVYRSPLIELIQYEPQTPTVHRVPLLFCPPWINKYYIMDLSPGRSLIEWAVQHGHTCFAISYRNPDESMRDTSFDDYMFGGPLDALRVVREITGAPAVNTLSVCLGGTLTAMTMAYAAATGDRSIKSATLINTHTDFSDPGVLGAFTDEAAIEGLERKMAKRGYLDAGDMSRTFDAIRANDLVFTYVVNNWLLGEKPPAFDLLAWNNDSTRMTATMHSRYLRSCYLDNLFATGSFEMAGVRLDPGAVRQPTYVLAAVDDHIVPWQSGYATIGLLGGKNRFVLSTSGHIAGIVNPPSPKARHWTNSRRAATPEQWLAGATLHDETWWEDWSRWIAKQAGPLQPAPTRCGSTVHPPQADAPGTYVHLRA